MADMANESAPKRESAWINIIFNVVLPALILMKGERLLHLPTWAALCIALAFPVAYFIHDLRSRGRRNIISIIGFVSTLITGGVGLLHLPSDWIAIKEAAVPTLFAAAVLFSAGTKNPLVRAFLLNPDFFDVEKIENSLKERGSEDAFAKVMRQGTYLLGLSFVLSAVLNYVVARIVVRSPSGTEAFNAELGKLQLVSYPAIALPATIVGMFALWKVLKGIKAHAGLELEDILFDAQKLKAKDVALSSSDPSAE